LEELLDGERSQIFRPRLELAEQLRDVLRGGGEQALLYDLRGSGFARPEGTVQQFQRLRLRFAGVSAEGFLPLCGIYPAGRERDDLFMEALGPASVEREPAEQDHSRDRIRGLRQARARQVVQDVTLG